MPLKTVLRKQAWRFVKATAFLVIVANMKRKD